MAQSAGGFSAQVSHVTRWHFLFSRSSVSISACPQHPALYVLLHYVHKPPVWASPFPSPWQFQLGIFCLIHPLFLLCRCPNPCPSNFVSKMLNLSCRSNITISNPFHPPSSSVLPLAFFSMPLSLNHTSQQVSPSLSLLLLPSCHKLPLKLIPTCSTLPVLSSSLLLCTIHCSPWLTQGI